MNINNEEKNLIMSWFSHIEQMATDRKTTNGNVMCYQDCLDEIRVIAKEAKQYIELN